MSRRTSLSAPHLRPEGRRPVSGDQAFRMSERCLTRLRDVYAQARSFKLTLEEVSAMKHAIDKSRLPAYYVGEFAGMDRALWDALWRECFAWLMSCDGRLLTREQVDALTALEAEGPQQPDYRSPWSRIDSDLSRHVWKDANGAPMLDKPIGAEHRPWYAAQVASTCRTVDGKACRSAGEGELPISAGCERSA